MYDPTKPPVLALDYQDCPAELEMKRYQFIQWLTTIPKGPCEITLEFAPFDETPRSWEYEAVSPYSEKPNAMTFVINVRDVFFEELMETAILSAMPPEDEIDEVDWTVGIATLLMEMNQPIGECQAAVMSRCFDGIGFDVDRFLDLADGYMNEFAIRAMFKSYVYLYEVQRALETNEDMEPDDREMCADILTKMLAKFQDVIDAIEDARSSDMDATLNRILDEGQEG